MKNNKNGNVFFLVKKCLRKSALLFFLFPSSYIFAQDFHLSQYDASPMFLNPSMTGMFDGYYRIHAHYRTQWAALIKNPFTTAGLSFDMPVKKFGVGLQVFNYHAGINSYNVFSALLSLGYDVVFDKENNHHLALGIQGGIIQKSVNVNKLTFGNQYSPNDGGFDPGIPNGEASVHPNLLTHDINAGFLYYYAKTNSRLNPFIGLSAFHLTQPNEAFLGSDSRLPIRYYFHGGVKVNINEKIQLLPKCIYMRQVNDKEFTITLLLHYFLQDSDTYLILGPTYRNKDAAIIEGGIKRGKYICRVSYDITTSSLKKVSNHRGGFEISLTYIARKSKPNPLANCPRL